MKKILPVIILFFLTSSVAQAKLLYNNKEYGKAQVTTIKGFLYDIAYNGLEKDKAPYWKPQFAKAIVWMDRVVKSKKVYKLEKIAKNGNDADVIKDATDMVIKVLRGDYPNISPKTALSVWVSHGKRVIAEYKRNKNKIYWKLELKPEKPKP
tara:strand:- start:585 stop:1040 length:456 start_codon:yes stop_codon:yes gene_type:complete